MAEHKRIVDMTADEIRQKYRHDQNWPIQSFDAMDWAKAFIATLGPRINYQLDEATMLGWFANALMRGWDQRQWQLDAEVDRLNHPQPASPESGDEREALIEIGAKALYDETPLEEGGEAIDGFQVSPNTTVTWAQIVEHDGYAEIASDFRRMARVVLTAAWQARSIAQKPAPGDAARRAAAEISRLPALPMNAHHAAYVERTADITAIIAQHTSPVLTEEERRDAARWRALIGCGHLRMMGWAGFDKDGEPVKEHLHFGMEAWSHPHANLDEAHEKMAAAQRKQAVKVLTGFVDRALKGDPK